MAADLKQGDEPAAPGGPAAADARGVGAPILTPRQEFAKEMCDGLLVEMKPEEKKRSVDMWMKGLEQADYRLTSVVDRMLAEGVKKHAHRMTANQVYFFLEFVHMLRDAHWYTDWQKLYLAELIHIQPHHLFADGRVQ